MTLQIANKSRFYTRVGVLLTIVILLSAYGLHLNLQHSNFNDDLTFSIKVNSGETLWNIAERYNTGTDIRGFIYELRVLNSIGPEGTIYAGQELLIPHSESDLQLANNN